MSASSLTMAEVLGVVAPFFGLTPLEVRSRRQSLVVCAGRTAFCAMASEFTLRCDTEIARLLGRDATTVMAARKRHGRLLKFDAAYRSKIWEMQHRLGEMRVAMQSGDDDALDAARRFLSDGAEATLTAHEMQSICDRLIHVEQAFQELALFQMESSNG